MIAWALYAIAISAALGLAAWALERALGLYRRPTRWVWLAAMVGSIAIPLALLVLPRPAPTGAAGVAPPVAIESPIGPIVDRIPAASASGWPDLGPWLLAGWGLASILLLIFFTRSFWRLRRARRDWRSTEIAGEPVLESDSLGPAVVGVIRTFIAVPAWVRDLDEDLQALVLAHERSHQAASDPLLLWLGVAACVAVPWCAPLWWQLRRLRLAIEVDCDRRVLAGGASLARYGSLLLEVGRRSGGRPFALVGLFEPRSFLERRIRVMTLSPPRRRWIPTFVALVLIIAAASAIAVTPIPERPFSQLASEGQPSALEQDAPHSVRERGLLEDGTTVDSALPATSTVPVDTPPRFERTPFDDRPRCVENCGPDAILSAMNVKEAGDISGRCEAVIGMRIGTEGTVTATDLLKAEGACLEDGLRDWAESTRWRPARRNGEPVAAWIAQPVTTSTDPNPGETGGEGALHLEAETDPDAIARTTLRRAMTTQEMYRAENGEYADAFELDLSPPRTVTLEVRSAGEGYVMVARHDHGTAFCASSATGAIAEGTDC